MVYGRDDEIFEVVVNLIKNGAEACPQGGDIDVKLYSDLDMAVIEHPTTGSGIGRRGHQEGILLILDITQEQHRRWPRIASQSRYSFKPWRFIDGYQQEGQGTTFTVRLPLSMEESVDKKPPEQAVMDLPMTVLVIDDMESIVEMLGEVMNEDREHCFYRYFGDQAIEIYKNNRIDVVVCDLVMPIMDGWQVGRTIKSICDSRVYRRRRLCF